MLRSPIRTDVPLATVPVMNWLLVLLNVGVYLLDITAMGNQRLMPRYMLEADDPQVLHFLTYAFLHVNFAHLALNMVVLAILGGNVEDLLGHVGYLAFYLGGAVLSGVGFLVTGGDVVVGASGAVGAVMAAYLVFLPLSNITISIRSATVEVRGMYFVVLYFLYNVAMTVIARFTSRDVAYEAHVAGMIFGFAVALSLLLLGLIPRHPFDLLGLLDRWNRRRQYRSLVKDGYNPFVPRGAAPPPSAPAGSASLTPVAPKDDHGATDPLALRAATLRASIADAIAQRNVPLAAHLFRQLKEIDPKQFLPRQAQLDVANQLASQQLYADAADAYEQFLHYYPQFEQIEEVHLMLGLIYARYLGRYARAKECLLSALTGLHGESQTQLARTELSRIEPLLPPLRRELT